IPCLARSRGRLSAHRRPLTAYSIQALTSRDATRGAPITTFDGIGPFSGACSLTCGPCRPSINSLFSHCHHERFDVRSSNESRWRGPLFVCGTSSSRGLSFSHFPGFHRC
ncbi:hypothetical protein M405DRAFT_937970, partial [Rhizopogon salebrosus TDB-379]